MSENHTNWVAVRVLVLNTPQRRKGGFDRRSNLSCSELAAVRDASRDALLTRLRFLHGKCRIRFAVQTLSFLFG